MVAGSRSLQSTWGKQDVHTKGWLTHEVLFAESQMSSGDISPARRLMNRDSARNCRGQGFLDGKTNSTKDTKDGSSQPIDYLI